MKVTLPLPPSGNHRNEGTGQSTRHTAAYDAYIAEVGWYCRMAGFEPISGPVRARLTIVYKREVDGDNIEKPLWDSLKGHAYYDDKWIVDCHWTKRKAVRGEDAHLEVEVEPI